MVEVEAEAAVLQHLDAFLFPHPPRKQWAFPFFFWRSRSLSQAFLHLSLSFLSLSQLIRRRRSLWLLFAKNLLLLKHTFFCMCTTTRPKTVRRIPRTLYVQKEDKKAFSFLDSPLLLYASQRACWVVRGRKRGRRGGGEDLSGFGSSASSPNQPSSNQLLPSMNLRFRE